MVSLEEKVRALGTRPNSLEVQQAKEGLAVIDARLFNQLNSIALFSDEPQESEIARLQDAAEKEKMAYKTVLWLHQLYESYEAMMCTKKNTYEDMASCAANDEEFKDAMDIPESGVLNLSGLQLTRFVSDPGKLSQLVSLDLSKNNLEVLPDFFDSLSKLRVLNISGNMLKSLPESVGRCSSLLELDASFNQLEYLSSNFGSNLPNLQKLLLQLNKLRSIPTSICSIESLFHLEVQFNKLVALPANIGDLKNLRWLDASGNFNNLTCLPDSIGYASSLVVLDLSYNQVSRLPLSFGYLTQLKELKLLQNPLVFPPMEVVEHSTRAVVEYFSEQLKNSLVADTCANNTSPQRNSGKNLYKTSSSKGLLSWMGLLFGGICRGTSLGSSPMKFVDLRSDSE